MKHTITLLTTLLFTIVPLQAAVQEPFDRMAQETV